MSNKSISISIIIPIYNAQKYIEECLESILHPQTDSIEVICIDDGSTDQSIEIVTRIQSVFENVKLYHQNHKGPGEARNHGLSVAMGDYVSFLDSDDKYSSVEILQKMVSVCERQNADVCGCAFWNLYANGRLKKERVVDYLGNIPNEGKTIRCSEWQNDYGYTNFVYRRRFLNENGLRFPNRFRYEDPIFFLNTLYKADKLIILPNELYICRVGYKDSSSMDSAIIDILNGIRDNLSFALKHGYERLRERIIERLENEFYYPIKHNLNDVVMRLLLEINEINHEFHEDKTIRVLEDIYVFNKEGKKKRLEDENAVLRDYKIFDNAQNCMNLKQGFSGYLKAKGMNNICIYGTGLYGRLLCQDLLLNGIKVVGYIDADNTRETGDIPLFERGGEIPDCDLMIVTIRDSAKVVESYKNNKIPVISFEDLTDKILAE